MRSDLDKQRSDVTCIAYVEKKQMESWVLFAVYSDIINKIFLSEWIKEHFWEEREDKAIELSIRKYIWGTCR